MNKRTSKAKVQSLQSEFMIQLGLIHILIMTCIVSRFQKVLKQFYIHNLLMKVTHMNQKLLLVQLK
jgi:hypothetical protein